MQLKHLRIVHELTQSKIADELGISRNYISMVENGTRKYSKEWHDNYVNTIYILHARENTVNVVEETQEINEEIEKENIESTIIEKIVDKVVVKPKVKATKKTKTVNKKTTKK
ncbi:MAG: transcriptional regulator with XRE-family HTH domain [Clostridium sp.]|jgi:transcriptional regulator with XRE-family HTH domain